MLNLKLISFNIDDTKRDNLPTLEQIRERFTGDPESALEGLRQLGVAMSMPALRMTEPGDLLKIIEEMNRDPDSLINKEFEVGEYRVKILKVEELPHSCTRTSFTIILKGQRKVGGGQWREKDITLNATLTDISMYLEYSNQGSDGETYKFPDSPFGNLAENVRLSWQVVETSMDHATHTGVGGQEVSHTISFKISNLNLKTITEELTRRLEDA
ncbi:MAG: hypothetical protein HQ596_01810 [Candidatus Saganbacteria bacterium]|nr:hypothetical protein [Candidatus Saganbacteria bacterium]